MKSMSAVCVTLGILNYIAFVIGNAIPTNDDQLTRTAREANGPHAIDCQMGPWSNWSTCDPCSKMQFRSRTVEVFGQFRGLGCNQPLGDHRVCWTEFACNQNENAPCSNIEFQCESGTCIKKRLVCNGDDDCGDFSDETCDEPRRPCGARELEPSEMARNAGHGISILGSGARMNALNNEFYNGACSRVRDPNTLEFHRTPWNIAVLTYDVRADESSSQEIFETTSTLLKEILNENKFSISAGFSFKFEPSEQVSIPLNTTEAHLILEYERKEIIKQITEHTTTKNKSFMRVKGQVQMGTFRMRSRDLRVTDTFFTDVSYLPLEYAKGEYFRFLEDYGTHYAMSGKEGGEYELVYVLNKEYMKTKKVSSHDVKNCFNFDASLTFGGSAAETKAGIKTNVCDDFVMKDDGVTDKHALIDKVMASVRGGTVEAASALKTKIEKTGVMDVDTYVAWAKSLTVAPLLIHSQPEAIQSLIPVNMPHAHVKKENLKRAFEDYIAEYNVCKCQPCQNGGTVTLIDGKCLCLCLVQFEGLTCENIISEKLKSFADDENNVVQEGNWGCWSSWTSCNEGRQTRTRTCNTKGLASGTCKGEILDSDYC